jgi:peptide/nickel transport system substrate-binding protein
VKRKKVVLLGAASLLTPLLAACGSSGSSGSSSATTTPAAASGTTAAGSTPTTGAATTTAGKTLVIDNAFVLKTADPGHTFEPTGELVENGLYDTLLTFNGADLTKPVPDLARSYTVSPDGRTYTFTLDPKAKFSDGTPVTSADVVFSLVRSVTLAGNPSFLLTGEKITAPTPETVVMTSAAPNPALPFILPNPALGILNSKVVMTHGGTDAADASTKDTAQSYLDAHSAGSGPYVLSSFSLTSQVVLKANPDYWGTKPAWSTVVIRNVPASVQAPDVLRGTDEISVDLAPSQATGLRNVNVVQGTSPNVTFVFTNDNPAVSKITANHDFQEAVRYGINYASLVQLAGSGSVQAPGVVPSLFVGALPQSADTPYDLAKAKAFLASSGLGHPSVKLAYPSGLQVNGINFADLASRVQVDLKQVGINVTLAPASVEVALATYRAGTEQMGLWYWGPDFPDPSDYLTFGPGQEVGLRAGWTTKDAPAIAALAQEATSTLGTPARDAVFAKFQTELNQSGPFMPLLQTAQVTVATKDLTDVQANGLWLIDLRQIG